MCARSSLWFVPVLCVLAGALLSFATIALDRLFDYLMILAAVTFFTSEPGKQLIAYGQDSIREVKKVVWPTRKEALQMTGYVFAFVVVMALFLWLTDKTLEWLLYDLVLGWRR